MTAPHEVVRLLTLGRLSAEGERDTIERAVAVECPVAIEVDGFSHDVQPERDVWRDRMLTEAGYRVLHFSNEDVLQNAEGVVTAIRLEIERLTLP